MTFNFDVILLIYSSMLEVYWRTWGINVTWADIDLSTVIQ